MDSAEHPPQPQPRPRSRIVATLDRISPFWGPQVVVLAALLLDLALPGKLALGPRWLLPSVLGALLIGLAIAGAHPSARYSQLRRRLAIGLIGLVSAVNVYSLALLSHYLINGSKASGRSLIFSGVALWLTNILLFGLWFYEVDRGGPLARGTSQEQSPDFMFPQMAEGRRYAPEGWMPRLVDYLYLGFTNGTAFSPTDTMPLTAAAKWLMTGQAVVSLWVVVLVVARAVNILNV
jgi:uncharacterized membrane protein